MSICTQKESLDSHKYRHRIHTFLSEFVLARRVSNSMTSALKPPAFDDSDIDDGVSRDSKVIFGTEGSVLRGSVVAVVAVVAVRSGLVRKFTVGRD